MLSLLEAKQFSHSNEKADDERVKYIVVEVLKPATLLKLLEEGEHENKNRNNRHTFYFPHRVPVRVQ